MREWTLEIEGQVDVFEKLAVNVREEARNLREEALHEVREEEEKKEEEKRNRHYEELKFEEAKLKVKCDHEKKLEEDRNKSLKESGTKLPKLTIKFKFQGTHLDWLRFWSQFEN